jgi:hypothetical protein
MNIALEKCQEYVNGQLRRTYGDAFVRGNNGQFKPFSASKIDGHGTLPIMEHLTLLLVLYISSE